MGCLESSQVAGARGGNDDRLFEVGWGQEWSGMPVGACAGSGDIVCSVDGGSAGVNGLSAFLGEFGLTCLCAWQRRDAGTHRGRNSQSTCL